jgi:hypothetical protein
VLAPLGHGNTHQARQQGLGQPARAGVSLNGFGQRTVEPPDNESAVLLAGLGQPAQLPEYRHRLGHPPPDIVGLNPVVILGGDPTPYLTQDFLQGNRVEPRREDGQELLEDRPVRLGV